MIGRYIKKGKYMNKLEIVFQNQKIFVFGFGFLKIHRFSIPIPINRLVTS